MSDVPHSYSALSAEEQAALSVWIEPFEKSYEYEGTAALKKAVKAAPDRLRTTLLSQLLPPLIDIERKRQGRTPTLHELRLKFPDLADELTSAYSLLPDSYRLPVELRGYRVLRVVGEGGQAIVLRAQDDVHSAVAIKLSTSPQHNDLLLRERQLLGQCHHSGIPEVITSGVEEDRAFFIMPFLRGMTLADKYANQRPTATEVARIGAELCAIVTHLHEQAILHRDIKPQNVWIDDQQAVKLIDLGMAIERSSWGETRPAVQEFHGTPAFMSPEQAAADQENDGELSDVFSIGATLYWMGVGETLDPIAEANKEICADWERGIRSRLRELSGWPKALRQACANSLAINSDSRPTAAMLRDTLGQSARNRASHRLRSVLIAAIAALIFAAAVPWWRNNPAMLIEPTPAGEVDSQAIIADPISSMLPTELDAKHPPVADESIAKPELVIKESDFLIDVRYAFPEPSAWELHGSKQALSGRLIVTLDTSIADHIEAVEYRIWGREWKPLAFGDTRNIFESDLTRAEVKNPRPTQVRLSLREPNRSSPYAGPFTFQLDITQSLRDDRQRIIDNLIAEAREVNVFDTKQNNWEVREVYSERFSPVIKDFRYGVDPKEPLRSLLDQVKTRRYKIPAEDPFALRRFFARVNRHLTGESQLWVQIQFIDGTLFGPVRYAKPLSNDERRRRDVAAWKTQNKIEGEVAIFLGDRFQLTGLRKIAPQLTHLELVGKYLTYPDPAGSEIENNESSVIHNPASYSGSRTASAKVTLLVNPSAIGQAFAVPPAWNEIYFLGHWTDGRKTPVFHVRNSRPVCGTAIDPLKTTANLPATPLYVYIVHEEEPSRTLGITRYFEDVQHFSTDALQRCDRSRLSLYAVPPIGSAKVELYADKSFHQPLSVAIPGRVYARYADRNNKTIGYSIYEFSEAFIHEWADHAIDHLNIQGLNRKRSTVDKSNE